MLDKLICNLLNKVLGTYIENLDGSNLKLSLWSGNAVLRNLDIKQNALQELQLPIRPVYGHLDEIRLVIPWNNLFAGVWEAHVTGVVLLVAPNTAITYDAKKEEQMQQQVKMAMLDKIAEAKAIAASKQTEKAGTPTTSPTDDGYLEKLLAQIVRNIQVTIKNVHIRYEDCVSTPDSPFSCGVTLTSLSVVSTDKNYSPCLDTDRLVYKLLSLEGLGVYWQPNTRLLTQGDHPKAEIRAAMVAMIPPSLTDTVPLTAGSTAPVATAAGVPTAPADSGAGSVVFDYTYETVELQYILCPLRLTARLQLNPRPELDHPDPFTKPKLSLTVTLHNLDLGLSRSQYSGAMVLLESADRMQVAARYRKHRPSVTGHAGHARLWWQFAYQCHLENIRRVQQNWSWTHMRQHRDLCRSYHQAYKTFLLSGSAQKMKERVQECEAALDLFNIRFVRSQVEIEVEREGRAKQLQQQQKQQQQQQSKGWLGGWLPWGGGKQVQADGQAVSVPQHEEGGGSLAGKLSAQEQAELFEAIGYTEGSLPLMLPKHYQDIKLHFLLSALTLRVTDTESSSPSAGLATDGKPFTVVKVQVAGLRMGTAMRSAANAVRFECSLGSFLIDGIGCDEDRLFENTLAYRLVDSLEVNSTTDLVDLLFETNPLADPPGVGACTPRDEDSSIETTPSGQFDQRLVLTAHPLQIVYHGATVTRLVDLLAPPRTLSVQQLQAAALNKLEVARERSVTGLQAAIADNTRRDLRVTIQPSRLVLPENGQITTSCCVLVMSLGALSISSVCHSGQEEKQQQGLDQKQKLSAALIASSYDKYFVKLTDVQVVVCGADEPWQNALLTTDDGSPSLSTPTCSSPFKSPAHSVGPDPPVSARRDFAPLPLLPSAPSSCGPQPSCLPTSFADTKYLLPPTRLEVEVLVCAVPNDPRLPKLRVSATLPVLSLTLADDRLTQVAYIVHSTVQASALLSSASQQEILKPQEMDVNMNLMPDETAAANISLEGASSSRPLDRLPSVEESLQYTNLVLLFDVQEVSVVLVTSEGGVNGTSPDQYKGAVSPLLAVCVRQLGGQVTQRTHDLKVALYLQHLSVQKLGGYSVELISTSFKAASSEFTVGGDSCDVPDTPGALLLDAALFEKPLEDVLLHLTYKAIAEDSPDLHTVYRSTRQFITVSMASLSVHLEHRAISALVSVTNNFQSRLQHLTETRSAVMTSQVSLNGDVTTGVPATPHTDSSSTTPSMTTPLEEFPAITTPAEKSEGGVGGVDLAKKDLITGKNIKAKDAAAGVVLLRVKACMEQVSVTLSDGCTHVAFAHITDLSVHVVQDSRKVSVMSTLRDIGVDNPSASGLHQKMVSVEDRTAWDCSLELYGRPESELNVDAVDARLTLTMGKTRLLFLNSFIANVLGWANAVQSGTAVVASAGVVAAEAARANLTEIYQQQPRIALDCTIKAPIVVVPESSTSNRGLLLNFGQLRVRNSFQLSAERNQLGQPAMLDNIDLTLTDLKISTVEDVSASAEGLEHALLSPITFSVAIVRNLSSNWLLSQPLVAVNATLHPIQMCVREEDIRLAMSLLQHNLGEAGNSTTDAEAASTLTDGPAGVGAEVSDGVAIIEGVAWGGGVTIKRLTATLTFTIQAVTLQLRSDGAQGTNGENPTSASPTSSPLSELTLHRSELSVRVHSDSSVEAAISVQDCTMDDVRPGNSGKGITRLLQRKVDSTTSSSMIKIEVERSMQGDLQVELRVSGFTLVVHLPYLLKLQAFFLDNLSVTDDSLALARQTSQPEPSRAKVASKVTSSSGGGGGSAPRPSEGLIKVSVSLEQPDIALVHDMANINTTAIFLHGVIKSDVLLCQDQRNITASLERLQLYTCVYNIERRAQTMSQIVSECSVHVIDSATANHADSVQLKLGEIDLRCTPDTIELVACVLQSLGRLDEDDQLTGREPPLEDLSNAWLPRPIDSSLLPALNIEQACEALPEAESSSTAAISPIGAPPVTSIAGSESAIVELSRLTVTLETGSGALSVPLVKMQARANCSLTGFLSDKIVASGSVSVEAAYYNPRLAVWEPLLEPLLRVTDNGPETTPPTVLIQAEMELRDLGPGSSRRGSGLSSVLSPSPSVLSFDGAQDYERVDDVQPPILMLKMDIKDPLELMVSRSFLSVWESLSASYLAAYNSRDPGATPPPPPPYSLNNSTGYTVVLQLHLSQLQLAPGSGEPRGTAAVEVCVESGGEVSLYDVTLASSSHRRQASLVLQHATQDSFLHVKVPDLGGATLKIPVGKACKRYYPVSGVGGTVKQSGGIVACVEPLSTTRHITLSSCVKVTNSLSKAVEVYFMTERGNEVELVKELQPGESTALPLRAVHTPTAELFFCAKGYSVSLLPLVWRGLQNEPRKMHHLTCVPRTPSVGTHDYNFVASCQVEQILWSSTSRRSLDSVQIEVELRPRLQLHNLLPYPLAVTPPNSSQRQQVVPSGTVELAHGQLGAMYLEVEVIAYGGRNWKCGRSIEALPAALDVWTFVGNPDRSSYTHSGGAMPTLELGVHTITHRGTTTMALYCPFWMVNKTGLNLTYRGDVASNFIYHSRTNTDPILFSFRSKTFFGKKKASIRAEDSDWSDKFALDAVGSSGIVTCRSRDANTGKERLYQVSVSISLSANGLTKMVVITPFYKVVNRAPYTLLLQHQDTAQWFHVEQGQCQGLWADGSAKAVRVRVDGLPETTAPIAFDLLHSTLFRMDNKFGGVFAEAVEEAAGGGILLILDRYKDATAAALLVNQLQQHAVTVWQKDHPDNMSVVLPGQVLQFGWAEAVAQPLLCVQCGDQPPLTKELATGVTPLPGHSGGFADIFSSGQRCLVFSDVMDQLEDLGKDEWTERVQQEWSVSLSSCGLSLVDDITGQEVMYAAITSSGVVWESRKRGGRKRRPFNVGHTEVLETAFQRHSAVLQTDSAAAVGTIKLMDNLEVDFHNMRVKKPFDRHLHRTYEPGLWLQLQTFPHRSHLHFKVNKVQVDNQLSDVLFPVVFFRVNPAKSIMAETVPKPLFELSVVQVEQRSGLVEYKYVAALLQEFHVMVEIPFVIALLGVLYPATDAQQLLYTEKKYKQDDQLIQQTLSMTVAAQQTAHPNFFHFLHLSPIKMHLSFSLTGLDAMEGSVGGVAALGGQVLHLFLQSVGVTLTEMQDIEFRLAYFERKQQWSNWNTLATAGMRHYSNQVLSQLYVVVLGLDVLGNPLSFVVGLTKGMGDLFYEPIQGAVEGPGEFAEGLVLGARSFMGKTFGGLAGVASRITGTIGKGVASLTLDDEYQKRRREQQLHKPADGLETMARGVRGLGSGVLDGVTGVFLKPVAGAREEGVEGFFKGVGKGVVGLVTRPASGVIDFASGSLGAVKRATDSGESVSRQRPARHIASDGIITPYERHTATGSSLLKSLEKGRYASTDYYVCHIATTDSNGMLLATDNRLLLLSRSDILGQTKVEWEHSYEELTETPYPSARGLRLNVRQEKKRVLGMFGGGNNSKDVMADTSAPRTKLTSASRPSLAQIEAGNPGPRPTSSRYVPSSQAVQSTPISRIPNDTILNDTGKLFVGIAKLGIGLGLGFMALGQEISNRNQNLARPTRPQSTSVNANRSQTPGQNIARSERPQSVSVNANRSQPSGGHVAITRLAPSSSLVNDAACSTSSLARSNSAATSQTGPLHVPPIPSTEAALGAQENGSDIIYVPIISKPFFTQWFLDQVKKAYLLASQKAT